MSWKRVKQNLTLFKRNIFSSLQKVKKSIGGTRVRNHTNTRSRSRSRSRSGNRRNKSNLLFDYPIMERREHKVSRKMKHGRK